MVVLLWSRVNPSAPPLPQGHKNHGINVRKGSVTDMAEENVVQPLLVSTSAIGLASECVRMILKVRYRAGELRRLSVRPDLSCARASPAFRACSCGGERNDGIDNLQKAVR